MADKAEEDENHRKKCCFWTRRPNTRSHACGCTPTHKYTPTRIPKTQKHNVETCHNSTRQLHWNQVIRTFEGLEMERCGASRSGWWSLGSVLWWFALQIGHVLLPKLLKQLQNHHQILMDALLCDAVAQFFKVINFKNWCCYKYFSRIMDWNKLEISSRQARSWTILAKAWAK